MCTVTIIPKGKDDFILTSNRDEAPNRISLTPQFYNTEKTNLLFPKDEVGGGTWVGISSKNRVVCLLNGGFEKHVRKSKYRQSRGVVVKDLMLANDIDNTLSNYNLEEIEPFTVVIADWNKSLRFFELIWDGAVKHVTQLPLEPKIWSSSTLYSSTMRTERLAWFDGFKSDDDFNNEAILNFHKSAGGDNLDYGTVMDRGHVKTTSITQINKTNDEVSMRFESLVNGAVTSKMFKVAQAVNE